MGFISGFAGRAASAQLLSSAAGVWTQPHSPETSKRGHQHVKFTCLSCVTECSLPDCLSHLKLWGPFLACGVCKEGGRLGPAL